jgi:PTH2 family peptidyl-tRNA hydrolase
MEDRNELRSKAERAGLPTFTVADAGRTQVAAGSKTVLVIGPGSKASVDAITRHLRLL